MVDKIIGHWKFDETSGSIANDSTTNNNDGVVTGTSVGYGLFDNSRVFYPYTDNRVVVNDTGLFDFQDQQFTISVWIKQYGAPDYYQGIVSKWDEASASGNISWSLYTHTDGTVRFDISQDGYTSASSVSTSLPIVDGKWHLLTVTRAGPLVKLYLDGAETESSLSTPTIINSSSAPLSFGNYSASSSWDSSFDGYIDNVKIYNFEMTASEVSNLFYDNGYDRFPPWFQLLYPDDGDLNVPVDSPISFRYLDEHTDLSTLFVKIEGNDVVAAGDAYDGYSVLYEYYTDGYSDGYDGYNVTLYHDVAFPARETVSIDLVAQDAYGTIGTKTYSFSTSSDYDPPPTFDNLSPAAGDTNLTTSSTVYFEFNDSFSSGSDLVSGADLSSLFVTVDGTTVIDSGVIQAGYSGSIVANGYDGFSVTFSKDSGWGQASTLDIEIQGRDLNGTLNSLSYKLKLGDGPVVINESPADGSTSVIKTTSVEFIVRDAVYGINEFDINAWINSTQVITNGVETNGHTVGITEIEDGYSIVIDHPDWTEYTSYTVQVDVQNRDGYDASYTFSFRTQDETDPYIVPLVPSPNAERVSVDTNIEFNILDLHSGPDYNTLDVNLNGQQVVVNGYPQPGYNISISPITDGYNVVINKESQYPTSTPFVVSVYVEDHEAHAAPLSYRFSTDDVAPPVITNYSPSISGTALPISDVAFDIHDRNGSGVLPDLLNVTIDSNPAIVLGSYQTGFTGSIIFDQIDGYDGYHVVINPDSDFILGNNISVEINVQDAYGLSSSSNYSFYVDDIFEPVITNLNPSPDGISSLHPIIQFQVHDSGGSGVDDTRLNVSLDGTQVITNGVVEHDFDGGIYPSSVDSFDGYTVWFRSPIRFAPSSYHYVEIDGYDNFDNRVLYDYQFITTDDTTVPTFESFNPYPGEIAVDRDTAISFEFNDNDGSSWLSNMNTLNVFVGGTLAVENGLAVNGYSLLAEENLNDGYDITITPPYTLPEFEWISVDIDGYDQADNLAHVYYDFRTADETSPIITNLNPGDGYVDVSTSTDITFDVIDGYSGVNLDSLYLTINDKIAVNEGQPLEIDGYSLSVLPVEDGYSFIVSGSNLNEWELTTILISIEDVEGNLSSTTYSFQVQDATGPVINSITPLPGSIDVPNHVDINFDYTDTMSGSDINKLTVLANGTPLVTDGAPAPNITMSATAIPGGYNINLSELIFTEAEEIEIEIDGYDLSGNRTFFEYWLTGAYIMPQFSNISPPPGTVAVPFDTDIQFDVTDAYGIDQNSIDMYVGSYLAISDGVPQDGYSATFTPITNGYRVLFEFNQDLEEESVKEISIFATDGNGISGSIDYSFKIYSSRTPIFVYINPPPYDGYVIESEEEPITFSVRDPAQNGIIPESLHVHVNGYPAIIGSEIQDGYSGSITPDTDGYSVVLGHPRFIPYSTIYVNLFATNMDGNSSEVAYFYNVGETSYPDVSNQTPEPDETGASRDTTICFDITDYTDVDFDTIEVKINDELAFESGEFVSGFDGEESNWEILWEEIPYHFEDLVPVYNPVYVYYPEQYYSYEQYYQDAYFDGYEVIIIGDGYNTIDGYLDGYYELVGQDFVGYQDDGYDGYLAIGTRGFHFCIDKISPYLFAETVDVDIYAKDVLGNGGTRSYSFTIESESAPPVFDVVYPSIGEQDILLESDIIFRVTDALGSGVLLTTLNATIAGKPAILGGEFQDGYWGNIGFLGDGYEVTIEPEVNLPNWETISVSLYAEDYVGNSSSFDYSFQTVDINAPVFTNIYPAPNAIDVATATYISFEFNDNTDSGANPNTLNVTISGEPAIFGGIAQDGYSVNITPNDNDGYDVVIYPPTNLPEFTIINIDIGGYDNFGNYASRNYSWKTADETPPSFVDQTPIYPGDKASRREEVYVKILETGSGLDEETLNVSVDGYNIITDGITQPVGFVTSLVSVGDGNELRLQNVGPLPHDIDAQTVALWRMDDHLSSKAYNATGDTALDGDIFGGQFVPGKFGYALYFSAQYDAVIISNDPSLNLQEFTVEAWIKPTSLTTEHTIYTNFPRQTSALARGVVFKVLADRSLALDLGDGTASYYRVKTSAYAVTQNAYSHVAVSVNISESTINFFVNGELVETNIAPVSNIEYSDGLYGSPTNGLILLGNKINPSSGSLTNNFVGVIDDVRVSNIARTTSDIANSYNRSLEVYFSEYQLVPVVISASDNSGNDGYASYYFFTADETPPVFTSFYPASGADRVDTSTNIAFDFTDIHSGPNLNTLTVYVDEQLVVNNGIGSDAVVSTSPIADGYRVEIDLDYSLPEFANIVVSIEGYDIDPNLASTAYQFSTDDFTSPVVAERAPENGETEIDPFGSISFAVHDFGGSGVALDTVNVIVDGDRNAIINGEVQPGWTVGGYFRQIDGYDGYQYSINCADRFDLDRVIEVYIDGYDAYGNFFDEDYSFRTYKDITEPQITNLDPASGETEVSFDTNISFDITDGYDVDINSLDVYVEGMPAILNGAFQYPFNGGSSLITAIPDGYSVIIDPDIFFVYNQEVNVEIDGYDLSGNHVAFDYSFFVLADIDAPVVSNRDPYINEIEVEISSGVEFDITDAISGVDPTTIDVSIDEKTAVVNGVVQAGWDGPGSGINEIVDGYVVKIEPRGSNKFFYNETHTVIIDGYDYAFNQVHDVYSFNTTADLDEPVLGNLNPYPGQIELSTSTSISFDITDTISGVDLGRLDVSVNSIHAVTDGVLKGSYAGDIAQITDGYSVLIEPPADFDYDEIVTVVVDGYDYANNALHYVYQFTTKVDVDGPTITPIDPVNGVVDVSRDTDVTFRIVDNETGVDFNSLDVYIDGIMALDDGEFVIGSGFPEALSSVTKLNDGYEIFLYSSYLFEPGAEVPIVIDGYDNVGNHTHFEYSFTSTDDEGPMVFDFTPLENTVSAENNPVRIRFNIKDYGPGTVDPHSLFVTVSENIGENYDNIYDPSYGFSDGWYGSLLPATFGTADGYRFEALREDQGRSYDVYSVQITASDNHGNTSTTLIGKEQEFVATTTGTIVAPNKIDVGQIFIDNNEINSGDMAIIHGVGEFEVDGYNDDEVEFVQNISATGTQTVSFYRGSFMIERRDFGLSSASATSSFVVLVNYSDPYQITGSVLDPAAYDISGGDNPINVVSVEQVDEDTVKLTLDYTLTPDAIYTVTVNNPTDVFNLFDFTIDSGKESTNFIGPPDIINPRLSEAYVGPYNINITVVFDEEMEQSLSLFSPSNYILSHGAYATGARSGDNDREVVLTVERLYGRETFDLRVVGVKDRYGNPINTQYNTTVVTLESTTAALSGITGRLKTKNSVVRLYEDETYWYVGTEGGLDVVSKLDLDNIGFVTDAYGVNAIAADSSYIYFGSIDGYDGVYKLSYNDLDNDSTSNVDIAFNTPTLQSNKINDLSRTVVSGKNIIAVGTDYGATIIVDGYAVPYSSGYDITAVKATPDGILYLGNSTLGRVEVYYNVDSKTVFNPVPDAFYNELTSPGILGGNINQIEVTLNDSIMDEWSNTIYVATDNGLTRINADESIPGSSESGGVSFTYGIIGSGTTYEILGGSTNRVEAIDVNTNTLQIFVLTDDDSHTGGVTVINIPSNTRFSFLSETNGSLISSNLSDLTFKNL